jgi:7-cyano-7-deazaguanine synthase
MKQEGALVILSGGLDSVTTLYWAMTRFATVEAFSLNYGQRHCIELDMAAWHCQQFGLTHHRLALPLDNLLKSAMLKGGEPVPDGLADARDADGVPHTYVPFRNGILLSLAAALGESRDLDNLVTGFNCIDTPDYPDTTLAFTRAMQAAIVEGTGIQRRGRSFKIQTPLLEMNKREIVELGLRLGVDYSRTLSCYRGEERPCLHCPSCEIRSAAFSELGLEDPLISRLNKESSWPGN